MQRLEEFGVDVAELAVDLPARLDRISEAIETGGLEVHLRADEMDALLARTERLANRVAASVLVAAVIDGLVQLATERRRRRPGPRRRGWKRRASRPRAALIGEADAREARLAADSQEHEQALTVALELAVWQVHADHHLVVGLTGQVDRSEVVQWAVTERIFGECELHRAATRAALATSTAPEGEKKALSPRGGPHGIRPT